MEIIQIIGVGFCGLIITLIIREYKPEFRICISLVTGIIIFFMIADNLSDAISLVVNLSHKLKINNSFVGILFKITGIAILSEFAVSICKDMGENSIAEKIDFGRKDCNFKHFYSCNYIINGYFTKTFMKERKMKKKLIMIIIFFQMISIPIQTFATEKIDIDEKEITNNINNQINQLEINSIISDIEKINDKNIDLKEVFNKAINGKPSGNLLLHMIGLTLGKQLRENLEVMVSIIIIIIIYSILKNISQSLGNNQTEQIGHFIQIIILITVLLKVYTNIIQIVKQTIDNLSSFTYSILPVFISLSIASGNVAASTGIQGIILTSIELITGFINKTLIPILMIATVIGIISNISNEVQMTKLAKLMKNTIIWVLCIMLTIFTCILSMESNLGQGVDEVTSKTTKTVVSTFVPVVGKILGDTVDSVLSCSNILKNAVGTLGIIAVISITISPLIKTGVILLFFYILSGIAEIVADEKIVYVVEQMGDSCKVLFACLASIMMMLIIGFTITMKITTT